MLSRHLMSVAALASTVYTLPRDIPSSLSAFDYVIIGAGTSGLVIANRLSENPNITVAIIEAGDSVYDNANVTDVSGYGLAFGTYIDWAFQTVNQTASGGNVQTMRAAKAIGGTSTINGMAYTRAQNSQIDNWNSLGRGWNWDSLFPYYLKSENIQAPNAAQAAAGAQYDPSFHGTNGPLMVGWANASELANSTAKKLVADTFTNLGVPVLEDIAGGLMNSFSVIPKTIDTEANIRFDAARAYYWPCANRSNLHLFANTLANRLVWSNSTPDTQAATASGVSVTTRSGVNSVIVAKKEVIVSAGALRSPVFLELSGIGNPTILIAAGVKTVVDLPTVGENLQDQTNAGMTATSNAAYSGIDNYVIYPTAHDIFGESVSEVHALLLANLTTYAERISALSNNVTRARDLYQLFKTQADLIFDGKTPMAEIIVYMETLAIDVESWTLLPFSRGNVHITSSNASDSASINPNYYELEWDVISQVALSRYIRRFLATAPFSTIVQNETSPGLASVPVNGTDAQWFTYLKSSYRSNFHPVSTAAMMPKEIGGVVDNTLTVYGTSNVRVVDASVLPFQVCGHLVSTLYAVAERAADIIKAAA